MVLLTAMGITEVEVFVQENGLPPFAVDVLRNGQDCVSYIKSFHGKNKEMADDLFAFKNHQLATSTMTLDIFLKSCYDRVSAKAFGDAFFQSFTEEEVGIINKALDESKTTLEEVYAKFLKNPKRNIMRQFKF